MAEMHYKVEVESDHIRKLTSSKPVPALAELVWNSMDADSTRVDVEFDRSELGMQSIFVRDNGHGIPYAEVPKLFGKLGGSWKAHGSRSKTKSRMLHGKEGKGRFKALALGRVAEWQITYREGSKTFGYTITIIRDNLVDVRVSELTEIDAAIKPGVEVKITELDRAFRSLEPEQSLSSLAQIFALYLTDYSDTSLFVDYQRVDPSAWIKSRSTISLAAIEEDGNSFPAEVELIEWTTASERWLFLCGPEGFPFHRISPHFHTPGVQFSAYLKSPFVSHLQQLGILDLAEMNMSLQSALDEAGGKIKLFFQERDALAARTEIDQWKAESVYPYREEPRTTVEQAERKVFEIVALTVNRHLPEFSGANRKTKAFQLRMLRQAIERGPDELQHILTEVLDLPERKQQELSKLLEEADLASVISASKLVSDRLKFVHGLEALLFDPDSRKLLKERSQLHRMIAENNTWIFGEEFNLTVDDESLTEVLRKHRKLVGEDIVIDQPVKRIDGKVGIVDLMLSRSVPQNHADEREHLVVELKRPSVKVGADEITQVKKYAFTIADDERFRHLKTRWSFWVISNDLDAFARRETRHMGKPKGQVFQSEDGNIEVWVKSWSEVLAECKSRMKFVQDHLQANVDKEKSLRYLQKTYDKYLAGVVEIEAPDEAA